MNNTITSGTTTLIIKFNSLQHTYMGCISCTSMRWVWRNRRGSHRVTPFTKSYRPTWEVSTTSQEVRSERSLRKAHYGNLGL